MCLGRACNVRSPALPPAQPLVPLPSPWVTFRKCRCAMPAATSRRHSSTACCTHITNKCRRVRGRGMCAHSRPCRQAQGQAQQQARRQSTAAKHRVKAVQAAYAAGSPPCIPASRSTPCPLNGHAVAPPHQPRRRQVASCQRRHAAGRHPRAAQPTGCQCCTVRIRISEGKQWVLEGHSPLL